MTSRIRAALLGTVAVAAVGAGVLAFEPARAPFVASATAQGAITAPNSFADVVERVKPAVVSVRVTQSAPQAMNYRELPGMDEDENGEMERFMRRFGEQFRNDPALRRSRARPGVPLRGPRRPRRPAWHVAGLRLLHLRRRLHRDQQPRDARRDRSHVVLDSGRTVKPRWSAPTRAPTSPS
jgi:serine protease Do